MIGARSVLNVNANLLVALDALLTEQSVTAAAKRVGITQSSMSASLSQLRGVFDDPLLVRVGRSMRPTPLAERIASDLRRGVDAFDEALAGGARFDPSTSKASFVLALSDRVEMVLFAALMERVTRLAPGVTLQVLPWGSLTPPAELATGDVDVSVGVLPSSTSSADDWPSAQLTLPRRHHSAGLYDSGLVSVVRLGHPRVSRRLTLDSFCKLDHVLVTERLGDRGIVDDALSRLGRHRHIVARVPRHTLVADLIRRTDLVATIDRRVAQMQAQRHGLRLFKTPVSLPRAQIALIWHERTHRDPARVWLREQVLYAARESSTKRSKNHTASDGFSASRRQTP